MPLILVLNINKHKNRQTACGAPLLKQTISLSWKSISFLPLQGKKRGLGSVVKRTDFWDLLEQLYVKPQDPTCNSSFLRPCLPHLMALQPTQQVTSTMVFQRSKMPRDAWGVLHQIFYWSFATSAVEIRNAVPICIFWIQTSNSRTVVWCFLNKTETENEDIILFLRLTF